MNTLSPDYKRVLQATHESMKGWGAGGKYHWQTVVDHATAVGAKSILDYGCGQGTLKELLKDQPFTVTEYDPGIPAKDLRLTCAFDFLVCTDVLEHIEPDYVDATLAHMRWLTRRGIFAIISLSPAKLTLTDGRNAHLTIQPAEWWLDKLREHKFIISKHAALKGLHIWATV